VMDRVSCRDCPAKQLVGNGCHVYSATFGISQPAAGCQLVARWPALQQLVL
jgi:hypothetical protein